MKIEIPVSIGEIIDKLTILQIKSEKIKDSQKLQWVKLESELLNDKLLSALEDPCDSQLVAKKNELYNVNLALWQIEDDIRLKEKKSEFDEEFIHLARSVYHRNDQRGKIKLEINK